MYVGSRFSFAIFFARIRKKFSFLNEDIYNHLKGDNYYEKSNYYWSYRWDIGELYKV